VRAGLRGAEAVDDGDVRNALEERLLVVRRENRATRAEDVEPGQVVLLPIELLDERTRERVAHDRHRVRMLALDETPDLVGVEPAGTGGPPWCSAPKPTPCAAPCMNGGVIFACR